MSVSEPGGMSGQLRDYQHKNPVPLGGLEMMTAALEMTKDKLGISQTVDRTISDPTVQRDALWKYDTSSGRPLLEHLVNFIAVEVGVLGGKDDAFKEYLTQLESSLPKEIQKRLEYESTLPFQDRNPQFQAFHNALTFAAITLAWLDSVTTLHEVNDLELTRSLISSELPVVALKSMLQETATILDAAKDYLASVGPNNPNFDKLINYQTQIAEKQSELSEFAEKIKNSNISSDDIETLNELTKELNQLSSVMKNTDIGNELRILDTTLVALNASAAALTLENGSPLLALGLLIAGKESGVNESSLGVVGDGFLTASSALSNALLADNHSPGAATYFSNAINVMLLGIAIGATKISEDGYGILPDNENQNHQFSMQLTFNFLCASNFIDTAFETLAKASGFTEQDAKDLSQILTPSSLFLAALAGSKGDETVLKSLILSVSTYFNKGLDFIDQYVNDKINNGLIESETGKILHAHILQAKVSLENEDIQGFVQAYLGAFSTLNIDKETIEKDLKTLLNLADSLSSNLNETSEETRTGFEGFMQF